MSTRVVNALPRHTAGISRRGSLQGLGVAGLAALAGPLSGEAKKRSRKKGKDKKTQQEDRCPGQVEPCVAFITALCAGDAECLGQASCCDFLERCDITTFLTCVANAS